MNVKNKLDYDAWIIYTLDYVCNLRCEYCFNKSTKYNINKNPTINIKKLFKSLKKTRKTFLITFTGGGEPFLFKNIIEASIILSKNHFLTFNTNLTIPKIKEFAEKINPNRVKFIVASLHLETLKKMNLLDTYIENFLLLKNKGFNISPRAVAYPKIKNNVKYYMKYFKNRGINIIFDPYLGEFNNKPYPESYTKKELKLFNLNDDEIKIFQTKNQLCNSGYNFLFVNPIWGYF